MISMDGDDDDDEVTTKAVHRIRRFIDKQPA
jgi:hypothetical protein